MADSRYLDVLAADRFKAAVDRALITKSIPAVDAHRRLRADLLYQQRYLLARKRLVAHQLDYLLDRFDAPILFITEPPAIFNAI